MTRRTSIAVPTIAAVLTLAIILAPAQQRDARAPGAVAPSGTVAGVAGSAGETPGPIFNEFGEEVVATFSIVARDPATDELGVAVQSRAFRAGAIVSYAKAGVGAIATQAAANQTYGPRGLELLELGLLPDEVVEHLTGADPGRDRRQLAVIDAEGRVRAYTGSGTSAWQGTSRARTSRPRATSWPGRRWCRRWRRRSSRRRGRSRSASWTPSMRARPPGATRAASRPAACW